METIWMNEFKYVYFTQYDDDDAIRGFSIDSKIVLNNHFVSWTFAKRFAQKTGEKKTN